MSSTSLFFLLLSKAAFDSCMRAEKSQHLQSILNALGGIHFPGYTFEPQDDLILIRHQCSKELGAWESFPKPFVCSPLKCSDQSKCKKKSVNTLQCDSPLLCPYLQPCFASAMTCVTQPEDSLGPAHKQSLALFMHHSLVSLPNLSHVPCLWAWTQRAPRGGRRGGEGGYGKLPQLVSEALPKLVGKLNMSFAIAIIQIIWL